MVLGTSRQGTAASALAGILHSRRSATLALVRNTETKRDSRLLLGAAPFVPYVALGIGLGIFQDAWVALLLYHAGALPFLIKLRRPLVWWGPAWRTVPGGISRRGDARVLGAWRLSLVLMLACLGATGLVLQAALWNPLDLGTLVPAQLERFGLTGSRWGSFLAYHALVNPWIEEMLWRGRLGSARRGVVATDLLFAGYHGMSLWGAAPLAGIVIGIALLTAAGWFWRQTTERGGLLLAVVSHMVGDLTVLLGASLLSR